VGIIGWIVLGLLAGLIAKAIMPGAERAGRGCAAHSLPLERDSRAADRLITVAGASSAPAPAA
jgi:hypothetical protein